MKCEECQEWHANSLMGNIWGQCDRHDRLTYSKQACVNTAQEMRDVSVKSERKAVRSNASVILKELGVNRRAISPFYVIYFRI